MYLIIDSAAAKTPATTSSPPTTAAPPPRNPRTRPEAPPTAPALFTATRLLIHRAQASAPTPAYRVEMGDCTQAAVVGAVAMELEAAR